jgi:hypothetical protein
MRGFYFSILLCTHTHTHTHTGDHPQEELANFGHRLSQRKVGKINSNLRTLPYSSKSGDFGTCFKQNPLYELLWIIFWSQVVKILPTKKGCSHELSNHKNFACHET